MTINKRSRLAADVWNYGEFGAAGIGNADIQGWRSQGKTDDEIFKQIDSARREGTTKIGHSAYGWLQGRKAGDFNSADHGAAGFGRADIKYLTRMGKGRKQISGIINDQRKKGTQIGGYADQYELKNKDYKRDTTLRGWSRAKSLPKYLKDKQNKEGLNAITYRLGDSFGANPTAAQWARNQYANMSNQLGMNFQELKPGDSRVAAIHNTLGDRTEAIRGSGGHGASKDSNHRFNLPKNALGMALAEVLPDGKVKNYNTVDKDDGMRHFTNWRPGNEIVMKAPTDRIWSDSSVSTKRSFDIKNPTADVPNHWKDVFTEEVGHSLGLSHPQVLNKNTGKYEDTTLDWSKGGHINKKGHRVTDTAMSYGRWKHNPTFTERDKDNLWHMGYNVT